MTITTKKRTQLKSYFVKNAIPTESNFADLVDAQLNQADDGVFKLAGEPLSVVSAAGDQKRVLRFYGEYPAPNADWLISLKPAQNPADPATTRPGFGIADGAGNTRFFISPTGNVGIGTNNPADKLTIRDGDLRLEGGRYQRLKIISDKYWAGIELVARQDGESGNPYIDFTHGDLDVPNFGIRVYSPVNNTLTISSGDGTANLSVEGNVAITGTTSARKLAVNDGTNSGVNRGLWLWSPGDSAHVIYSANPTGTSPNNKPAIKGYFDNNHRMRFRTSAGQGFLFENNTETALLDIDSDSGNLWTAGALYVGNSDMYFMRTDHTHTGIGSVEGCAAIENAVNYGALMILGRQTAAGRIVKLWDFLSITAVDTGFEVNLSSGTGAWNKFVVNTTTAWGDGANKYVTIGAGGASGIMIYNPHVPWYAGESRASIRYGRTGGTAGNTWWDCGVRNDGAFTLNANEGPGVGEILRLARTGQVSAPNGLLANHIGLGTQVHGATSWPYETIQMNPTHNLRLWYGTKQRMVFGNTGELTIFFDQGKWVFQNDGNLVKYRNNGQAIWACGNGW